MEVVLRTGMTFLEYVAYVSGCNELIRKMNSYTTSFTSGDGTLFGRRLKRPKTNDKMGARKARHTCQMLTVFS